MVKLAESRMTRPSQPFELPADLSTSHLNLGTGDCHVADPRRLRRAAVLDLDSKHGMHIRRDCTGHLQDESARLNLATRMDLKIERVHSAFIRRCAGIVAWSETVIVTRDPTHNPLVIIIIIRVL